MTGRSRSVGDARAARAALTDIVLICLILNTGSTHGCRINVGRDQDGSKSSRTFHIEGSHFSFSYLKYLLNFRLQHWEYIIFSLRLSSHLHTCMMNCTFQYGRGSCSLHSTPFRRFSHGRATPRMLLPCHPIPSTPSIHFGFGLSLYRLQPTQRSFSSFLFLSSVLTRSFHLSYRALRKRSHE